MNHTYKPWMNLNFKATMFTEFQCSEAFSSFIGMLNFTSKQSLTLLAGLLPFCPVRLAVMQ